MILPKNGVKPSPGPHVLDEPFAAILDEDFSIETLVIPDALPQRRSCVLDPARIRANLERMGG